jgi:membrane fusion protein, multidrug efflux system
MKYTHYTLLLLLVACSKPTDKKAELADLKTQKQKIESQIATLEKELGSATESTKTEKIKAVSVSPIAPTTFKHFVEAQGAVEAVNTVLVSPQMGGAITGLYVQEGDGIKKGQLIATLDNSIMKESLEELKHQLALATTMYEKQKSLWDQQIGTEVQYIQAKSNKEAMEKRIATLQQQMSYSKVYAPISGTVEILRQKAGELAAPGMPILQLVNLGNLRVRAKIADNYLGTIKQGNAVVIKFPDINQEITARINVVAKTVNPITRTFDIEANIPNTGGMLKPNQIAVVNISDQVKAGVIVINQNFVQQNETGTIVYVAVQEGNKKIAKARKISTGLSYNGEIEITSGLQAGDHLITQGYQDLVDGQVVSY